MPAVPDPENYVFVEDDGAARALTPDELAYLSEDFAFGDGARPYIKLTYDQRTPDGRIGGFLHRASLPADKRG